MNSSRIDNGESAARPTGYTTRPGAGFVVHGTLDVAASPLLPGVGAQHIAQLAPRLLLALRRLAPPARPHFVAADPSNGAEGLAGKQRPPCQDGRNALALAVLR